MRHVCQELTLEPTRFLNPPILSFELRASTAQLLEALALGDIQNESDAIMAIEHGHADEDRNTRAVLAQVLFFPWPGNAVSLELLDRVVVEPFPFGRRHLSPAHGARQQLLPRIADHLEEAVIRFDDVSD